MATGAMSSKLAATLSPGITISVPSGNVTVPAVIDVAYGLPERDARQAATKHVLQDIMGALQNVLFLPVDLTRVSAKDVNSMLKPSIG